MLALAFALLPLAAALYVRDGEDDSITTFTGFLEPYQQTGSWSPKPYTRTSLLTPHHTITGTATATASAAEHGKLTHGNIVAIALWSAGAFFLLVSTGILLCVLLRRRRKTRKADPYADTPLPTLDHSGGWGFTDGRTRDVERSVNDGRGKWSRLDDEGALASPGSSPTKGSPPLYDDDKYKV